MSIFHNKKLAALVSIFSNSFLIVLKLIVGFITGSVSIFSEAVHSFTDLLASIIAFFSVKISSEPADKEHPFGHGKFEDISGFIEGFLLLGAAFYIIFEAIEKIISGEVVFESINFGIWVMLISVILNCFVSFYIFKVAEKTESIALFADAQHLRMDIYTSLGVLGGLILIKITNITMLDPIIAILISLLIIKAGIDICQTTAKNLLDTSLPKKQRKQIKKVLKKYIPNQIISIKKLKTRKAGNTKLIETTLIVPESYTIREGHDLCDKIETEINELFNISNISIHLEPCNCNCLECQKDENLCKELKNQKR